MTARARRDFPPLPPVHPTWRYFAVGKRHALRNVRSCADVAVQLDEWLATIQRVDHMPPCTPMTVTVIEGSLIRFDWTPESEPT